MKPHTTIRERAHTSTTPPTMTTKTRAQKHNRKKINKNNPTTGSAQTHTTRRRHTTTPRQPPPQPAPGSPHPAMDDRTPATDDDGIAIIDDDALCPASGPSLVQLQAVRAHLRGHGHVSASVVNCTQDPSACPCGSSPNPIRHPPHARTRENTRSDTTATNPFLHTGTARPRNRVPLQTMHAQAADTDHTHTPCLRLRLCR